MKQKLLIMLLSALSVLELKAQSYTIGTNFSANPLYCVQGMGVMDTMNVAGSNTNIDSVVFSVQNINGQQIQEFPAVWNATLDTSSYAVPISTLDTLAVGIKAYVWYGGVISDSSNEIALNILPMPAWLSLNFGGAASILSLDYSGNTITLQGSIPIKALLQGTIDPSMNGVGGKSVSGNGAMSFTMTYNLATNSTAITSQANVNLDLNFLGQNSSFTNGSNALTGNVALSIDNNFNVLFDGSVTWNPGEFSKDIPFSPIPIVGPVCLQVDVNLSVTPKIKATIVLGNSGGNWGFDTNGTDTTGIQASLQTTATIKGEIQALCGVSFIPALAEANVGFHLDLGASASYNSIDTSVNGARFGAAFYVDGGVTALGGFYQKSGTLYNPQPWGDTSTLSFITGPHGGSVWANTARSSGTYLPAAWPTPVMSARDSVLAIAWVDNVNYGQQTSNLLITWYDPQTNSFTQPFSVENNNNLIQSPAIALLPTTHNIVVTWVETSLPADQFSDTTQLDVIMATQNIWVAILEYPTGNVILKNQINDNLNGEAYPQIVWGNGNQGFLTWETADTVSTGNDIVYSLITDTTFAPPQLLTSNLPGYNYDLQLVPFGNNQAMAEWLQNPDMTEVSDSATIQYSVWNGSNWTAPQSRFTIPSNFQITGLTLSANDTFGLEGVSYEYLSNTDSLIHDGLYLGWWTGGNPTGGTYSNTSYDNTGISIRTPQAAVSNSGVATLTFHTLDLTDSASAGVNNIYINDLSSGGTWQNVATTYPQFLPYITDSTDFVWQLATSFGYVSSSATDILYTLSQEMDENGNTNPGTGVTFGHSDLNMVLRTLSIADNGGNVSIDSVAGPIDTAITTYYQNILPFNNAAVLYQNFPNPFDNLTTIPFHINIAATATLDLFDMNGSKIGTLLDGRVEPGDYHTQLHAGSLACGVYYYRLTVNNSSLTKKLLIFR